MEAEGGAGRSGTRIGGRIQGDLPREMLEFTTARDLAADALLVPHDLACSTAHVLGLLTAEIIEPAMARPLLGALSNIWEDQEDGTLVLDPALEDVHRNVESLVRGEVGEEVAGMLHLARSRNDQVLTDVRLYSMSALTDAGDALLGLVAALLGTASEHGRTVWPAWTHTRPAQPTTLAHWCAAHAAALLRANERLERAFALASLCPLGACAVTGTDWPINRKETAALLGFRGVQVNTMDVVTSRGESETEIVSVLALLANRMSVVAADLIWWSAPCLNLVRLSDSVCTSSSIMPQKRNSDVLELVRAAASCVHGNLTTLLSLGVGLPSGYNRDHQETKPPLFAAFATTFGAVRALTEVIDGAEYDVEAALNAVPQIACSTAAVKLLVQHGATFRAAHREVGRAVSESLSGRGTLPVEVSCAAERLGLEPLLPLHVGIALRPDAVVEAHAHLGGPAPQVTLTHRNALNREVGAAWERWTIRHLHLARARNELWLLARTTASGE